MGLSYLVLEREEFLSSPTIWMSREDMMLSETSQSQKDKCYPIPMIGESNIVPLTAAETRMVAARG